MKQKLKMFYECMKPNIALMMITILVVSLLSVGMVQETNAADLGERTNWRDADNVKENDFKEKGVSTQDSYTEYVLKDGAYVPNTVSINSAATLGSRENPYAIESEEDLILFGKLQNSKTTGKYFMLTKDVYDMQGNSKYMSPLFSSFIYHSGSVISTPFEGNLIGNNAVIKNAYIVDQYEQTSCNTGFFSSINNAAIWDLNIENSTFNITQVSSIGGFTYQTIGACALVNCNISYFINNTGGSSVSIKGFSSSGKPQLYNSSATLVADKSTITIAENISVSIGNDENIFAEMILPSSNSIYVNKAKISSLGNIVTVYKNGAFTIKNNISEDVVINDTPCTPNTTYNPIILDYADGTFSSKVYESGTQHTLDYPLKPSAVFLGWTGEGLTEPTKDVVIPEDFVGACTYVANWGEPINIETCDITFVDGNVYTYTGNAIQPKFLVKDGDKILEEGIDYEITCYNNVEISSTDIAFSPKAVVEGKGQYTGRKELLFTIEKATPIVHTLPTASKIWEGDSLATSMLTGGIVVSDETVSDNDISCMDGTFRWKDDTIVPTVSDNGVTTYTVVFEPEEAVHYHAIEMEVPVVVEERNFISLDDCDVTLNNGSTYTYAGKEIKPVVLVEYEGVLLSQDDDFEVSYSNNVNAATMDSANAPTVVVKGIGNFVGSKTLTFTIEKATPLIQTMPTASKIQEGDSLSASTLTGGVAVSGIATNDIYGSSVELVEGTFSWKNSTIIPSLADSGVTKYTVVFTPNDTNNFNTFEFGISVLVEKKSSTTEPGSGETGTQKPGTGESSTEKPATQPQVNDSVTDTKSNATYKVTSSEKNSVEVAYVAPMKDAKNVTIPETVTLKDNTVAKVTSIDAGAFKKNTKIQSVSIGKNVESIGNDAFNGCKNLKKVKIAKNVTKIGKNAFANCKKLTSVTLGSNLTTISEKAFYKCTSLKKITIPKKVNSIGKSAFEGCKNLKTVNIKTTKLTKKNVKKNAFKGTSSKAKFDVPNSKKKTYASILKARGASKKATIK